MKWIAPHGATTPTERYVNAQPTIAGSNPDAAFFNNVLDELLAVITGANLTPTDTNLHQILDAIQYFAERAATSGVIKGSYWFGKTLAVSTVPAPTAVGQTYIDFTTLKTYISNDGETWTESTTFVPPVGIDFTILITSKFWDITDQKGQQGGDAIYSHSTETWTYWPKIVDLSEAYHPGLFAHEWDEHIREDESWLCADTFSWHPKSGYKTAYEHLAADIAGENLYYVVAMYGDSITMYRNSALDSIGDSHPYAFSTQDLSVTLYANSETPVFDAFLYATPTYSEPGFSRVVRDTGYQNIKFLNSETIAGTTIYFYRAADKHKICPADQASNVEAIYNATGVAWYYIIDTVNEQFKLPRTKFGVTGLRDTVGNYVAPGAPNITGTIGDYYESNATGAFALDSEVNINRFPGGSGDGRRYYKSFDASRSSSVYGNSTTIQPPATQMYLYFYVGNFTQTALENTAGLNAELFNNKADVDLSNVNSTGKANSVSWGMPDFSRAVSTNLSGTDPISTTSDTYTCPSDGWIYFYAQRSVSGNTLYFYLNGISVHNFPAFVANYANMIYPVSAGDVIKMTTDSTGASWHIDWCNFVPCKGV